MPRINPLRSLANERNLAERVAFEREQRGWSYEGAAARMAQLGFPIQSSAIFKIEKGNPPRRITVDELVGFAAVFGYPVEEMLIPVEFVHDRRLTQLLETQFSEMASLEETALRLYAACSEYRTLIRTGEGSAANKRWVSDALRKGVADVVSRAGGDRSKSLREVLDEQKAADALPPKVRKAMDGLILAIDSWANSKQRP